MTSAASSPDFIGQRFGRLVAVRPVLVRSAHRQYLFRCDCGAYCFKVFNDVRRGSVKSCGCLRRQTTAATRTTHGCSTENSRPYRIWRAMKTRCYNPNTEDFKNYGGRGISVCDEWRADFAAFRDWALENGYRDDLTIDRIDNDGNYEPGNCRWATRTEQNRNTRRQAVPA
jgi:hypothetical protein